MEGDKVKQKTLDCFFQPQRKRKEPNDSDPENTPEIAKKTKCSDQPGQATSIPDDSKLKESAENCQMPKCTGSDDTEQKKSQSHEASEARPDAESSKVSKSQDSSDVPKAIEVVSLVDDLFAQKVTHHHDKCFAGCCSLSKNEESRMLSMKYKFQHSWLDKKVSYCDKTGIWWATYVEGEGIYCLLCKKHDCFNPQNKSKTFNKEASSRLRLQALDDHVMTQQHKTAVTTELLQRVSYFQKEIDEHDKVSDTVLLKVFRTIYWLVKEEIPNKKAESLIQLIEKLGLEEMKYFDHKSRPSLREMFLVLGEALECSVLEKLKKAPHFGILVDDVTDVSVYEQMVTFVQFYDRAEKDIKTVFLSIDNLLEESDSANAQTITQMIVKTLTDFELEIGKLSSFVSDGASVMTGKQNGVAARLKKEVNPKLISIHCICHRLALACTDTLEDATYFKQVQLWLVQLWKLFENSPKKLAVYFKVQTEMKSLLFTVDKSKNVAMHRLKKACQTRWLSFNSSVQAILKEYPTVLQTLNKLQSSDSAALGLLIKIRSFKFVSAVYILAEVLPHLDQLSKTFQLGTIGLCQVLPSIQYTNDKLDEIADSLSPVEKLCKDLETDGCLNMLELQPSDHDITGMKYLCRKYIDALKKNIEARFGNTLPILSSLAVIDANKVPGKNDPAFKSYGVKDIQVIAEYFDLDKDELTAEWGKLKYDLLRWNSEDEVKPQNECLKRLVSLNYFYPILSDLADILLSLPVSNAWPERGASAVKRIKTRLRSSLKNDMLQVLMNVSINGPEVSSNECDEVCKASVMLWLSKKKRKKLPTGKISKSTATASVVKCFSEAEVQTDSVAENVISREEISDIIRAELLAYDKSCRLEMNESDSQSDYDSDD